MGMGRRPQKRLGGDPDGGRGGDPNGDQKEETPKGTGGGGTPMGTRGRPQMRPGGGDPK